MLLGYLVIRDQFPLVSLAYTGFLLGFVGFTGFIGVFFLDVAGLSCHCCSMFNRVSLGFHELFLSIVTRFHQVLLGFHWFYWFILGFI